MNATLQTKAYVKLVAGLACLVTALLLPGMLALGIATNFGFGRASVDLEMWDWCLASPFALCAIGPVAAGLFLILKRRSPFSRKAKALVAAGAIIGGGPAIGMVILIRSHTVDPVQDRRRWLHSIDEANAKAGFIKDTNGDLIYVGLTNSQAQAALGPAK